MSDEYSTLEGHYRRSVLDLNFARKDAEKACWWSRRRADAQLKQATDDLNDAAQQWAAQLLRDTLTEAWARLSPHTPSWHPLMLRHLPALAEEAAAKATATLQPEDEEHLRPLLTEAAAESIVSENVEQVRLVVDDPTVYVGHDTSPEGEARTVLQHAASGLRARFTFDSAGGFGWVFSKPYSIDPIGPANSAGVDTWPEEYTGRGIGRRLYLLAATLHPSTRWRLQGGLSEYAEPLRTRLHGADPYRWEAPCDWCTERAIAWRGAAPHDFGTHPITPTPPAITPTLVEVS